MIFNSKNRIITKKISSNPSNIYMAGILSSSPFQNLKPHPQIRSLIPGIACWSLEVVPTPATTPVSNYFRKWNPRVPLRSSCQELRPSVFDSSIQPMVHLQSTILCSAPARVFSGESPPLLYLGFLRFSIFPSMQGIPLPPLTFPGGSAPPPQGVRRPAPPPPPADRLGSAPLRSPLLSPPPPMEVEGRGERRWSFCNLFSV
jgi:hypothetical protein